MHVVQQLLLQFGLLMQKVHMYNQLIHVGDLAEEVHGKAGLDLCSLSCTLNEVLRQTSVNSQDTETDPGPAESFRDVCRQSEWISRCRGVRQREALGRPWRV